MNSVTLSGVEITITDIKRNTKFKCSDKCWSIDNCDIKRELSLQPKKNELIASTVSFNIRNFSGSGWSIEKGPWELIDTDGFAYAPQILCKDHYPPRFAAIEHWNVTSGTQVNFMLAFPELEPNKKIAKILHSSQGNINFFDINPMKKEVEKLFREKQDANELEYSTDNWRLSQLYEKIDRLGLLMYQRLNNVLSTKEIQNLENSINSECFDIEQKIQALPKNIQNQYIKKYESVLNGYNEKIDSIRAKESKIDYLNKKVKILTTLSPLEFEEYCVELFRSLGYENITLTPYSGDQGIDILMEIKGKKYAVQCKRYTGIVGSPAIQTFIGAMEHAGASHGFFVTTSTFSIEAEKMASKHPIELVDSYKLGQLIQMALNDNKK